MLGTFATPARRIFGDDGECEDADHRGWRKGTHARNEFSYVWGLPRLGKVTSHEGTRKDGESVATYFMATELVYPLFARMAGRRREQTLINVRLL